MTTEHGLPDDDATRALARVLHTEVDDLEVSGDSLARIQARTAAGGRTSWRWIAPLSAAAVVAVIAAGAVLLPDRGEHTSSPPASSLSPSLQISSAPVATSPAPSTSGCEPEGKLTVPTYFVGTFEGHSALYRAFFWGDDCVEKEQQSARQVEQAVENMARVAAESGRQSLWPDNLELIHLAREGARATVTLNAGPTGNPSLAMQQLVYTVTAADNSIRTIGVELPGGSDDVLYTRAPAIDVLAPVWLTNVLTRDTAKGTVVSMEGTAAVFEANLNWQITDENGKVVDSGPAMTPEAAPARGGWKATSKPLPSGQTYTVTAYEASPKDGRMTWPDSRTTP